MSRTRTPTRAWARDLGLGMRFAAAGGKESWARTLLTAVGVGLGVSLLLVATAIPAMLSARDRRENARALPIGVSVPKGDRSYLYEQANTTFRTDGINGTLLKAEGPRAPAPPGLTAIPRPGTMAVSPRLGRMLADPGFRLLRERLPYRITATIGRAGLSGPAELQYYAGDSALTTDTGRAFRADDYGSTDQVGQAWDPLEILLVVIACVVLLVPVGVFIGAAVRFGGERRDRRLAALRLVGADSRMTRRIAAGEAVFGALIGLAVGAGIFLLARRFIGSVALSGFSVFPSDVTPGVTLTVLIAIAVPAAAVAVTLLTLRGVVIEPLGVVRNATPRRRRLWWRLLPPAVGLALLYPLIGHVGTSGSVNRYQLAAGTVLLLVGVTAVLPWLVEATVRRMGRGPLPWQLACRRLQLNTGSAARMVSGITVAVAGAIAVQTLFAGVQGDFTTTTGVDTSQTQMVVDMAAPTGTGPLFEKVTDALRRTPGVATALGSTQSRATTLDAAVKARKSHDPTAFEQLPSVTVTVADCAALDRFAPISGCRPGSVFVADDPSDGELRVRPGERVDLNTGSVTGRPQGAPRPWTVPAGAHVIEERADPTDSNWRTGILATPQALDVRRLSTPYIGVRLTFDPKRPDAADQARNTAVRFDPSDPTFLLVATQESNVFTSIRRGLLAGAAGTLLVIGAGVLVSTLEQLRERRRLLAVLVAFGTRRTTLGLSVLWQTAVPVVLGLVLAVVGGTGLGALLLALTRAPIGFDWGGIAAMAGIGAAVVFGVTALSLPPLWRMMRPDGLRTE